MTALTDMLKRNKGMIAACIVFAAAVLRVAFAGRFAFFIDELHAVNFTGGALAQAMRLLPETPGTAPLDYALVNLLQRVSLSEFWMRLPYALAGAWSVYLTCTLGARWFGRAHGLAASGMLALSAAHIYYSQSIRCYSLNILFMLLAAHAFDRLVNDDNPRGAGVRLALYSFLAAMNQFFALIPLGFLMIAGFALAGTRSGPAELRRARIAWLCASGAALALAFALCWKLILLPKSLGVFRESGTVLSLAIQAVRAAAMFSSFTNALINVFILVLAVAGLVYLAERRPRLLAVLAAFLILPAPLILFQEMRLKSGVQLRHFIFMAPFYFLAASSGLMLVAGFLSRFSLKCRGLRWARTNWLTRDGWTVALCAWIGLSLAASTGAHFTRDYEQRGEPDFRPDWRDAARRIADLTSPRDTLVAAGIGNGPWRYCLDFYLERNHEQRRWIPVDDIEQLRSAPPGGAVHFVYFDLPVRYHRDFTNTARSFRIRRINPFITLMTPVDHGRDARALREQFERFAYLTAPPQDFGIYSQSWTDLGIAARWLGDLPRAQEMQERAVQSAESSALNLIFDEIRAREELGETYLRQKKTRAAIEQWEAAAALVPPRVSRALLTQLDYRPERLHTRLAQAWAERGGAEKSEAHARLALRYNPDYAPARSALESLERNARPRP